MKKFKKDLKLQICNTTNISGLFKRLQWTRCFKFTLNTEWDDHQNHMKWNAINDGQIVLLMFHSIFMFRIWHLHKKMYHPILGYKGTHGWVSSERRREKCQIEVAPAHSNVKYHLRISVIGLITWKKKWNSD